MNWLFNDSAKPADVVMPETLDERIERLRADLARTEAAAREAQKALYEALLEKAETTHVTRFDPELDPLRRWWNR